LGGVAHNRRYATEVPAAAPGAAVHLPSGSPHARAVLGELDGQPRAGTRILLLFSASPIVLSPAPHLSYQSRFASFVATLDAAARTTSARRMPWGAESCSLWSIAFVHRGRLAAIAILDRLLHHSVTSNIRGDSYGRNKKLKAGLVRSIDDSFRPSEET
jgi:hypothetical protein